MRKTRAEIQKAYRERKRLEIGEEYRKKETERVKKYKIPIDALNPKQLQQKERKEENGQENTEKT